jgi:hypothetical protein
VTAYETAVPQATSTHVLSARAGTGAGTLESPVSGPRPSLPYSDLHILMMIYSTFIDFVQVALCVSKLSKSRSTLHFVDSSVADPDP